jgi:hypothetical protein
LIFHGSVPIQPTNKLAAARSMDFSDPPVDRGLRRPSFLSEESSLPLVAIYCLRSDEFSSASPKF